MNKKVEINEQNFENALAIAQGEGVKLEQRRIDRHRAMIEKGLSVEEMVKKIIEDNYEDLE